MAPQDAAWLTKLATRATLASIIVVAYDIAWAVDRIVPTIFLPVEK